MHCYHCFLQPLSTMLSTRGSGWRVIQTCGFTRMCFLSRSFECIVLFCLLMLTHISCSFFVLIQFHCGLLGCQRLSTDHLHELWIARGMSNWLCDWFMWWSCDLDPSLPPDHVDMTYSHIVFVCLNVLARSMRFLYTKWLQWSQLQWLYPPCWWSIPKDGFAGCFSDCVLTRSWCLCSWW